MLSLWGTFMKRMVTAAIGFVLLAAGALSAQAADLPRRMPVKAPPPAVAVFSWTGCYIGAHAGYGWGQKKWSGVGGTEFTEHDVDGFLAGGQVGCNLQQGQWVFGIEGQASWADIDGSSSLPLPQTGDLPIALNFRSKTDIVGTIAGRFGLAFGQTGQTMLYAKGGLAFAHDKHWLDLSVGGVVAEEAASDKYMRWGWMVGGGLEHAFNNNWSIKGEYNFMHLGNKNVSFCDVIVPTDCDTIRIKQHIHVVKFGINYRFGGGPVVARY
jgi:outer membrane immunogenic protein